MIASSPDEHCLFIAIVGTSCGIPDFKEANLAAYPASAACTALPITTSSTISGVIPARSNAAFIACDPRSGALTSLNAPPNLPTGVLAPLTITASFIFSLLGCLTFE